MSMALSWSALSLITLSRAEPIWHKWSWRKWYRGHFSVSSLIIGCHLRLELDDRNCWSTAIPVGIRLFRTIQKCHQALCVCVCTHLLSQLPSMDTDTVASYILLFNQAVWRKLPSPPGACDLSWLMACHRDVMHGNLAGCVAHAWVDRGLTHTH